MVWMTSIYNYKIEIVHCIIKRKQSTKLVFHYRKKKEKKMMNDTDAIRTRLLTRFLIVLFGNIFFFHQETQIHYRTDVYHGIYNEI